MKTARNISAYEGHDSNDSLYFKMNYPYIIWTEKCSEVIDHKLYCFHGILFSIFIKNLSLSKNSYILYYKKKKTKMLQLFYPRMLLLYFEYGSLILSVQNR